MSRWRPTAHMPMTFSVRYVGEDGTVSLPDPSAVVKRAGAACSFPIMTDWSQRFIEAYDIEFDAMGQGAAERRTDGPSAWDGYVACVTGDALILSRQTGKPEAIELMEKPSIY